MQQSENYLHLNGSEKMVLNGSEKGKSDMLTPTANNSS